MKRVILLLLLAAQSAFAAESVMVDSATRNVINTGVVNFAPNQLKVDNISVIGGAGGGDGGGAGLPSMPGHNGQFLQTDGSVALWATVDFAGLSNKPTTVGGYGITDIYPNQAGKVNYFLQSDGSSVLWVKPTTLAGFGISDAQPLDADLTSIAALSTQAFGRGALTAVDAAGFRSYIGAGTSNFNGSFTSLSNIPTTNFGTGGLGLTDVQQKDGDLTSLAAATGTNTIYYRSAADTWSSVTIGTNLTFSGGTLSGPTGLGTGDVSSNLSVTVPGEATIFADNTGKLITHATGTGIATLSAGVLGVTSTIGATQGGTGQSAVAIGDILYGSAPNTWTRLAGPTALTPVKYLRSVGSGSTANVPTWTQITFSELASVPTTAGPGGLNLSDVFINDSTPFSEMATGDKPAARTALGLQIGLNVQAWDTDLDALAGISVVGGTPTAQTGIPYRKVAGPPAQWGTITIAGGLTFDPSTGTLTGTSGGSGDVSSPGTTSVDGEVALYSGTGGKTLKRASGLGIAKLGPVSGVLGVANANTEYGVASEGTFATANTSGSPLAWTTGKVVMNEGTALTSVDGYSTLPAASTFAPGTIITYIDNKTTTNFGRNFHPIGTTDTLDGQTSVVMGATWLRPFIAGGLIAGQGVYQFKTDGTSAWVSVYADGRVTKFQDSVDANKYVTVDVSGQPTSPHYVFKPSNSGDSGSVADFPTVESQFVTGYNLATGSLTSTGIHVYDILSTQDNITQTSGTFTATNNNHIDKIRISATAGTPPGLSGALTIQFPDAALFQAGDEIFLYDASGSINTDLYVKVVTNPSAATPNTFNGNSEVIINDPYAQRRFIADPTNKNWTVSRLPTPSGNGSGIAFLGPLTESGGSITLQASPDFSLQTAYAVLHANDTLSIPNPQPGMHFEILVKQDSTGGWTLKLPSNSLTPSNGLGLINIASAPNAVTKLTGTYYGVTDMAWAWEATLSYSHAAALTCNTLTDSGGTVSTTGNLLIASSTARTYLAAKYTPGATAGGNFCRVDIPLYKVGTIPDSQPITCSLWTDSGAGPGTQIPGASVTITAGSIPGTSVATATKIPFAFGTTYGTTGTVIYVALSTNVNASNHPNWVTATVATGAAQYTWTGNVADPWVGPTSGSRAYLDTYH